MTLDRFSDASWRVRMCSSRPGLAHLSLSDHRSTVTLDALDAAVDTARSLGASRVRTCALFDETRPTLDAAGFDDVEHLVLLQRRIDPASDTTNQIANHSASRSNTTRVRLHRLGPRSLSTAARVDAAAFGLQQSTDRSGLADALLATPTVWGRYATLHRLRRPMAGFAVCGASGTDGYIQRLAVDPSMQRQGIASTLVAASLDWMTRRGISNVLVNTRRENQAALALYEQWGFERLRCGLLVAERAV